MFGYAVKRIGLAVVIVFTAVILLFLMVHSVPGDPVSVMLGPRATPELKAELMARMQLDQPLPVQLFSFISGIFQGNLGVDVFSDRPVLDIVMEQLPFTVTLILVSIAWSAVLGILLGCYSALHRNSWFDKVSGVISVGTLAAPSFVVSIYALLIFAVSLKWFPAIGAGDDGDWLDQAQHLVLPAFAIGLSWVGYIARLVRASMLEIMGEKHVRTARAFGLSEQKIIFSYALRLAILPTITVIGIGIGFMMSNAVFAEIVFARPGVGKLIFDAVLTRNYPIVMGAVLATTILFVMSTTLADLLNAALDPRVRTAKS